MAAVPHTITDHPRGLTGLNLTDAANWQTLVVGAGNGASFVLQPQHLLFLRNDTGGDATFTIAVQPSASQVAAGATVNSPTKVVVTAKIHLVRLSDVFVNVATQLVNITCDVAAKVLVVNPNN